MTVDPLLVYVVVVSLVGLLVLVRVLLWLRRSAKVRVAAVERRSLTAGLLDAGGPVAPAERATNAAEREATDRAIRSIEGRFTVTRRLAVPLVMIVTGLVLSVPFLTMVPAALVSIVAAVATVTVGIAARPFAENAIAGLTISFAKVFQIGDTVVIDEHYGTIEDITITHTTLKRWDWKRYVMPNAEMLRSKIVNYTLFDRHLWVYVEFWVSYDADLEQVRRIALEAPAKSSHWTESEDPRFWIMEMAKEGYRCWIAAWADGPSDAWMLGHDIRTELVLRFRENSIRAHGYHHDLGGILPTK